MKHLSNLLPSSGLRFGLRFGLAAACAAVPFALAQPTMAQQVQTETAEETVWGSESRDPFSQTEGASGLLDLMQQLNRSTGQSWAEFRANQAENLNSAADDFRARQLQLLQKQPVAPAEGDAVDADLQSTQPSAPYRALW